jgi:hypothetical protein
MASKRWRFHLAQFKLLNQPHQKCLDWCKLVISRGRRSICLVWILFKTIQFQPKGKDY